MSYYQRPGDGQPKRGDILQSAIGTKRERTWLLLRVKSAGFKAAPECGDGLFQCTKLWAERWWEIEPATRLRLHRSAERAGGQCYWPFYRFRAKRTKPKTFFLTTESKRG